MRFFLALVRGILNFIYFFHKLAPTKRQITILSRQGDEPSLDFSLLIDELKAQDKDIQLKVLCKKLLKGFGNKPSYFFHLIGPQMHALATSKVAIIDGYCIGASVLKHKKELKVIQTWHAMGALKKFGHSILDTPEGSSKTMAKGMRMHANYDYILTSSRASIPVFSECFDYGPDVFKVIPLPRTDVLRSAEYMSIYRKEIQDAYPETRGKKNILYAPTFRTAENIEENINALIDAVDYSKYNIIVKLHPLMGDMVRSDKALKCEGYNTLQCFSVSDYVISDYSAVIFEATTAGIPVFLYTFDYDSYKKKRGLGIEYGQDGYTVTHKTPEEVINAIENHDYDPSAMKAFADKYVDPREHCTGTLATFILSLV